ncbi:MAG TPA: FAD-dependent oxidoreductase [Candidatus Acidoferrum sp.]|nr:FAD-dependent oxidoreductase [Candidatus Acidoferrum sp.]
MEPRKDARAVASRQEFDICVIGGGATGAGCALDGQLRGLSSILLDAGDFASAASSASTKLVHGGVRYLEQAVKSLNLGEYRMVKNALRERQYMLANAPHLAHPSHFLVPVYSWSKAFYYLIGMKMYDAIAGKSNLFPSSFLSREETLRRMPGLNGKGLRGAVAYSDGQFDDARYDLALVETFSESGGTALNYARVTGFARDSQGKISAASVRDGISADEFVVKARKFVNATGTGADKLRLLANPQLQSRMRPSKGVHLLFPADSFPGRDALLVPHTEDGRVIFAVPWQERLLVGTTDDEVTAATRMVVEKNEAEYLLRQLNPYLAAPLRRDQVVSGLAGLRPLVAAAGQTETSKLIRDHEVEVDGPSGLISILGGKWTTHRLMAEDTIDALEREMGRQPGPSLTRQQPLAGAQDFDTGFAGKLEKEYALPADVARHLAGKFGNRARKIADLSRENPAWKARVSPGAPAIEAELVYSSRFEMAETIEDLLARRTGVEMYGWGEALAAAPVAGEVLAREKGWDRDRQRNAVAEYTGKIRGLLNELELGEG